MKIFTTCMECMKELGHPSFEPIIASYYEEAVAIVECNKGHKSALLLQSLKFEVLMESAANALIEGYTLEASSVFYSAYERFLEFCIRVLCNKRGISQREFEKTFKQISRQSERQIGAFLYLYLLEFGITYTLNKKITEFRNKVIHKGYIPTQEEAVKNADKVYMEIYSITKLLKENYSENIQNIISEDLRSKNSKIPEDMPRSISTGTMFYSLSQGEQHSSFSEALNSFKVGKDKMNEAIPEMKEINEKLKEAGT